jgi:hypothetical protein
MRTEATPDFLCINDYGSYSGKAQGAVFVRTSQFVSNLCPKCVRDIETYLKISNSIEMLETLKMGLLQWKSIIIFMSAFSTASYTR